MEWLSDVVAERWREIRFANEIVLAGATLVLVKRSRFGRQIKTPDSQLSRADFEARKRIVARVARIEEAGPATAASSGPAVLHVWHEPPVSWWLGLRVWPLVDKSAVFPVRVFGVRTVQAAGLDPFVQPGDQVRLELLSRGPRDAAPNTVLAHVQYKLNANLALDLVKSGAARADAEASPGRDASQDLKNMRDMDAALAALCKADPDAL